MRGLLMAAMASASICHAASSSSASDLLDRQAKALKIISDFSESFCTPVTQSGDRKEIELSASAKAELNGLIKKLAELGVQAAAKYKNTAYEGLLQQDLAGFMKDREACKQRVWNDLKDKLLPSKADEAHPPSVSDVTPLGLRQARMLRGVDKQVSVLEMIIENNSPKLAFVNGVTIDAASRGGFACFTGEKPNPWQPVVLNWQKLTSQMAESESAVWTSIDDVPIRVHAEFKLANCGDYSHRLRLKVPVQREIPSRSLTRLVLKISEEPVTISQTLRLGGEVLQVPRTIQPLSEWGSVTVRLDASFKVKPEILAVKME